MERYLQNQVALDLTKKMVFLGGPRQVGKTTLALNLIEARGADGYLNWDIDEDRAQILDREFPSSKIWVFDEIHKYRGWRNLLKGLYDKHKGRVQILVTGSARLDYYRYGGDSLQGRYHYLRLHPLSVAELGINTTDGFQQLVNLGGFPEPFLSGSAVEARRWSREYRQRLIREDMRTLEQVQDVGRMELLAMRLPELVGSPLSINSLREDLQVAHKTASKWIDILERLYHIFLLAPFGSPKLRAVKKERKHYQFDWSTVPDIGFRFENAVASHLLKWCQWLEDTQGDDVELRYFRDVDGREVDFVVVKGRRPILFVEAKWTETTVSPSLRYLRERFPTVRSVQVVGNASKEYVDASGIEVINAIRFLGELV